MIKSWAPASSLISPIWGFWILQPALCRMWSATRTYGKMTRYPYLDYCGASLERMINIACCCGLNGCHSVKISWRIYEVQAFEVEICFLELFELFFARDSTNYKNLRYCCCHAVDRVATSSVIAVQEWPKCWNL